MQYPKMLYKGDQENYQTVIADDEDHEAELVADGWANYGELPETISEPNPEGIIENSWIPTEQFDALASKVAELEEENAQLKEVIEKGSAENAGLRKQIQLKELEDMPADDLKAMLDEKGVQYGARDNKATLVNLVLESDGGE
jgi:cytochrome c biogenesis protein ResB